MTVRETGNLMPGYYNTMYSVISVHCYIKIFCNITVLKIYNKTIIIKSNGFIWG